VPLLGCEGCPLCRCWGVRVATSPSTAGMMGTSKPSRKHLVVGALRNYMNVHGSSLQAPLKNCPNLKFMSAM